MLVSTERAGRLGKGFSSFWDFLSSFFPGLGADLRRAGLNVNPADYAGASFLSALIYGVVFGIALGLLSFTRPDVEAWRAAFMGGMSGVLFFGIFFGLHVYYPKILIKRVTAGVNQSLVFALKSLLIQVSSGVSLYNALANVAKSNYGEISKEFDGVVQDISSGMSEAEALEKLALKTKSEYLKKTCWQLTTSLRTGASLASALGSLVENMANYQMRQIKDFAAELNLLILLYLLLAAAVPTIGITFLVILSSLGGASVGDAQIVLAIGIAFILQIVLIGFVQNRVPKVYA